MALVSFSFLVEFTVQEKLGVIEMEVRFPSNRKFMVPGVSPASLYYLHTFSSHNFRFVPSLTIRARQFVSWITVPGMGTRRGRHRQGTSGVRGSWPLRSSRRAASS